MPERRDDWQADPKRKARWSLTMVLTWIVWRDFEYVRDADNDYRTSEFLPPMNHVGIALFNTNADGLQNDKHRDYLLTLSEAIFRLFGAANEKKIVAMGIPPGARDPIEIPAAEFLRFGVYVGTDEVDYLGWKSATEPEYTLSGEPAYRSVTWNRDDILDMWRADRVTRRAWAERDTTELIEWCKQETEKHGSPPTFAAMLQYVQSKNLSKHALEEHLKDVPKEYRRERGNKAKP